MARSSDHPTFGGIRSENVFGVFPDLLQMLVPKCFIVPKGPAVVLEGFSEGNSTPCPWLQNAFRPTKVVLGTASRCRHQLLQNFQHRVNGVGGGGGQAVYNQILTRFH